jgi:hypothetical protein
MNARVVVRINAGVALALEMSLLVPLGHADLGTRGTARQSSVPGQRNLRQLPRLARRVSSWIGKGQHYYWRIELLQIG